MAHVHLVQTWVEEVDEIVHGGVLLYHGPLVHLASFVRQCHLDVRVQLGQVVAHVHLVQTWVEEVLVLEVLTKPVVEDPKLL